MGLEEKLKRLAEKAAEEKVDWESCKSEWIARVSALYDDVEAWLAHWKEKGYLATTRTLTLKSEEPLGDYEIETLEITAGDETVVLEPFRRLVIGALGRVDVYLRGFKSDAQMLLSLEDVEGRLRWELWRSKFSGPRLPFNKDTFERLLEEWL